MPQKKLAVHGKKKMASAGSQRKQIGITKKHKHTTMKGRQKIRDKANSHYVEFVEKSMASKLPSDQRDKLTVVRSQGAPVKKKNMKKPLTRGRRRK